MGSFAVAAQLRKTTAGTTARITVALPEAVKITPAALMPALLNLSQQALLDYRLSGRELPEVEVTAVERVETAPTTGTATRFTLGSSTIWRPGARPSWWTRTYCWATTAVSC
ncbi:hypothetical protein [Kocuria sp. SM24M-10]|uniref:hypothetical protein n=1 Tax=Kocuria sp. SM24M-10 TaxID=1660349 RepID=UPI00128B7528|nr:hypothetical protein [Kocuria sp. SM24M-10]